MRENHRRVSLWYLVSRNCVFERGKMADTEEMKLIEAMQQENAERELQEQKKEILDSQIKIISALFD